jgi:phosphate transport system permease protein
MTTEALTLQRSQTKGLARAHLVNRLFTSFLWLSGLLALLPLIFILGYVVSKGIGALNVAFFTKTPAAFGQTGGGIMQSFVGSGLIVGMAIVLSVPIGLLAAVYLAEYGNGKLASVVRFISEVLLSTPSIVAGAVIWSLIVVNLHQFSAFAGAIALSVLMWPIIARAAEDLIRLVPQELREAGMALGSPRWKVIVRVVLPAAASGLVNAVLLALARGLGETAPVLLTALGNEYVNTNPGKATDTLSLRIFNYARQPNELLHHIAWGAALMLLVIVLILSITARYFARRERKAVG